MGRPPPRPAASALLYASELRLGRRLLSELRPCSLPGNMLVPPTSETTFSSPHVMCVLTQKDDKMTPGSTVFSSVAFPRLVVHVLQMVYLQSMPDDFSSDFCAVPRNVAFCFPSERRLLQGLPPGMNVGRVFK